MNYKLTAKRYFIFAAVLFLCCSIFSCKQIDVFEKNTPIPKYEWQSKFSATGNFEISDTTSEYNIYVVLRHADSYQYNNIWLNVGLQSPGDTMFYQKVNLDLGSDATGWEGTGMNDIWEVRKLLTDRPRRFIKTGSYKFRMNQIMRDDPLLHIMSAGMRIEKVR